MATSPREELVIEAVVEFAHFDEGWVWAEQTPDGTVTLDSGEKSFDSLTDAVLDFLRDEGVERDMLVDASEAHYSNVFRASGDMAKHETYHIRKYKYGAPDPIQAVK